VSDRWTILACGDPARGDDGAALAAVDRLATSGAADARIRRVGMLQVEHVIDALAAGGCLVVDAVRGVEPGSVVELRLVELAAGSSGFIPASSHALPLGETVRLAELLGADLGRGTFIGIGGRSFDLGAAMTDDAVSGVEAAAAAIERLLHEGTQTVSQCA
jgi:hydrogenase maturation protease